MSAYRDQAEPATLVPCGAPLDFDGYQIACDLVRGHEGCHSAMKPAGAVFYVGWTRDEDGYTVTSGWRESRPPILFTRGAVVLR